MDRWQVVVVDIVLMGAVHAGCGYLSYALPDRFLAKDRWLWRERRIERGGRLYTRRFRVNRWKHRLPEAGALFVGGYDKRTLGGRATPALENYVRETRRAETAHWLMAACWPLFLAFNPWYASALLALYTLAVNGPCVIALRSNRLRLARLLGRRTVPVSSPPGPADRV